MELLRIEPGSADEKWRISAAILAEARVCCTCVPGVLPQLQIARLKGLKARPVIKPSGMEDATERKRAGKRGRRRGRGKVTPRGAPEIKVVRVTPPMGAQFKGYAPYQVQDLVLTARVFRYRRERWLTPY